MKRIILGILLCTVSISGFAYELKIKKDVQFLCKEMRKESRESCEEIIFGIALAGFSAGRVYEMCKLQQEKGIKPNAECKTAFEQNGVVTQFLELHMQYFSK